MLLGKMNFQKIEINDRDDYYGGDARGRTKLLKEIIEILKEEAQDKMAVAVRFSPDENTSNINETYDFFNEVAANNPAL